ncbi:hypothetical protein [Deinococcus planocerae]|uniref:hypothetical protein n=1 Tax=Deinococcus planocerae TaxID=1737569 RepID=UPI000C7F2AC2|nr:hypothetical protein [Deinococcus planocerae]
MDTDLPHAQARLLRQTLRSQGQALGDEAARAVVARFWEQAGANGSPLGRLDEALREHGLALDAGTRSRTAWTLLGVAAPGAVRLTPGARGRLTHLVELHDLSLPSRAREVGGQLARERTLTADLRRARPWLGGGEGVRDVLAAVFDNEWSGFLSLLGEFGPWVYAPSVADLQALSHRYAALVRLAAGSREEDVLAAAVRLGRASPAGSLLARLEATAYRAGGEPPSRTPPPSPDRLVEVEQTFWDAAQEQARGQRDRWAARRRT